MAKVGAKKIGFLKKVEPNFIDQKKLDTIEMGLKVKANEFDERICTKTSVHHEGKNILDVIPVVFAHQQKVKAAALEMRNMQNVFNSVVANPCYDSQIE